MRVNAVCSVAYPEHLVQVVILLPGGVEQEGVEEEPGVRSQPQHLRAQDGQGEG